MGTQQPWPTTGESTDGGCDPPEAVAAAGGGGEGKGTWKHAAFHVATTIATPAAYAPLPFALASLGWPIGSKGYWSISFFQQVAALGNNIAIHIAAGSSLKAVYKYYHKNGTLTLQDFIIFFGVFELLLSQLPDIHSLRWVNALCTCSTVGFACTTIGVTIYNALKILFHTLFSSFMINLQPEIYDDIIGYWAFGSGVQPYILSSLTVPEWTIVMANIFAVVQISGCFQVYLIIYCRPTYAHFENLMLKSTKKQLTVQNCLRRLFFTSSYMVVITLVAAVMPFFGDFVSICGAIGFTPLDFVFPALAFLKAGKLSKTRGLRISVQILNLVIAGWFSIVAMLGCIGAVRFIIVDIKTYKFFHDM
ncbi:GABA transporter 1 [Acorus gramineus]|uniref:GABA transporter 1 n=1 Tax=Acorus gramineus TaxID=55184 RepID=A0AAV9B5W8_ACOGR|nr:GABA transporter 1 [Acorus gramineus]